MADLLINELINHYHQFPILFNLLNNQCINDNVPAHLARVRLMRICHPTDINILN